MIDILCLNIDQKITVSKGSSLLDILATLDLSNSDQIVAARVNNRVKSLSYTVIKPKHIEFITVSSPEGRRVFFNSLSTVIIKALRKIDSSKEISVKHRLDEALYCEFSDGIDLELFSKLKLEVDKIIEDDIPFVRSIVPSETAASAFEINGLTSKADLFRRSGRIYGPMVTLGDFDTFMFGHDLPSSGYLRSYSMAMFKGGIVIQAPIKMGDDNFKSIPNQPQLFNLFKRDKEWGKVLNLETISDLNKATREGRSGDIIKLSEALHEKMIAEIASDISKQDTRPNLVLIAGPSSSGKTTFSKRLAIQLQVCGVTPHLISMDNYFVNREDSPKDENGEYDFESVDAIDRKLFGDQMSSLFKGEEVDLPTYNFAIGEKQFNGEKLKISKGDIVIVEGIHGLNPVLIENLECDKTYKIFVSALTQLSYDKHNFIYSTDSRLIRRLVRDFQFRNYPMSDTIKRWRSVRRGEDIYINPFQEEADIFFNSALLYELAVLKNEIEPILQRISESSREYSEAVRLLDLLAYFEPIDDREIPPTSILREFYGGSSFSY